MTVKIEVVEHETFGPFYDLYPFTPGAGKVARASTFVVSQGPGYGFRPRQLILPHQLYVKDAKPGEETWVLPVLSSWLCVVGRDAGEFHPPVPES